MARYLDEFYNTTGVTGADLQRAVLAVRVLLDIDIRREALILGLLIAGVLLGLAGNLL